MPEESTTPDPVELTREFFATATRQDIDAVMRFYARDAVWDLSGAGIGSFEGVAAIRDFVRELVGHWQDHHHEVQEVLDLGHGVVFAIEREDGQLVGSDCYVEQLGGWVFLWTEGKIRRGMGYLDIDEARAAAERLAEERG